MHATALNALTLILSSLLVSCAADIAGSEADSKWDSLGDFLTVPYSHRCHNDVSIPGSENKIRYIVQMMPEDHAVNRNDIRKMRLGIRMYVQPQSRGSRVGRSGVGMGPITWVRFLYPGDRTDPREFTDERAYTRDGDGVEAELSVNGCSGYGEFIFQVRHWPEGRGQSGINTSFLCSCDQVYRVPS